MGKTLIIGSAIVDVCMELERLPLSGQDIEAYHETINVGGCALNVASVLKAYEVPCTLFVPVGTGQYGKLVKEALQADGFEVLLKIEGQDNGHCFAFMEASGERTFVTVPGVESRFQKEWFRNLNGQNYSQVFVSGYSLNGESGKAIVEFLEENSHMKVFFAPGPRITAIEEMLMERLFSLSPTIHLNEEESLNYTGEPDVKSAARALYERTKAMVVITRGARGAYYFMGDVEGCVAGEQVKVVNTSGAGDAHLGGLLTALEAEKSPREALQFANQVSAAVVSKESTKFKKEDL